MSYLVLARKYRPHTFEELVGQEHVVQALSNALTQQRLHHAYLFTGTRGVGKTTVSRILAKSLNCTGADGAGGITATPCGVCDACRDIDAGRFVDYIELDAASNRGVEEISQLLDQSVYKPVVGRFKVYMIDEVHMLSNTAFNAMLKTLEEPPDYLKFVLATTDPQKVPVTVLSRCLQFNLRPMAAAHVLSHLTHVLAAENVPVDAGSLRLLSRAARGSMRDALSLADQAIAFGAGALTEADVRQMLGSVDRGHVVAILDALIAGSGADVVAQADGLRSLGLSAAGTLEDLAGLLQQMAVAQAAPAALDAHDPDTAEAQRLAALLPADEIQLMYSMALHGRQELALAPDEYAGLVMVLLRMLAFRPAGAVLPVAPSRPAQKPVVPARALVAAAVATAAVRAPMPVVLPLVAQIPPMLVAAPPPAVYAVKPVNAVGGHSDRLRPRSVVAVEPVEADDVPPWLDLPADENGVEGTDDRPDSALELSAVDETSYASTAGRDITLQPTLLGERWQALIAPLGLTALTRELAMQAQCVGVDDAGDADDAPTWTLRVERDSLRQPALKDKLQTALVTALQRQILIVLEPGLATDSPALRDAAHAQTRQRAAEQIVRDDPLAQALMLQFKTARIVPGSIRSN